MCMACVRCTYTQVGDVLLFYDKLPNTHAGDFWHWHGSCAVTSGEKWAANLWFHAGSAARAA